MFCDNNNHSDPINYSCYSSSSIYNPLFEYSYGNHKIKARVKSSSSSDSIEHSIARFSKYPSKIWRPFNDEADDNLYQNTLNDSRFFFLDPFFKFQQENNDYVNNWASNSNVCFNKNQSMYVYDNYSQSENDQSFNEPFSPVLCNICDKSFSSQRILNRHLSNHNRIKKYSCYICEKGFNDGFDLKRHVRTHTGIKPFKCHLCSKAFTQRCSLEAHGTRVHGILINYAFRQRRPKLHVCETCGVTFEDSSFFRNHMTQHTSGDLLDSVREHKKFKSI